MKLVKSAILASVLAGGMLFAGDVLATVNGTKITKSKIDALLKAQNMSFDKLDSKQQQEIVNKLVERELLVEVAKKAGVDKEEKFKKALEDFKKDLAIRLWMNKIYDRTIVSDSEAKKYYEDHKDKFKKPEQVHARHILVKTEDEAKKIIDELKKLKGDELKKKFIELAKSKSIGPSGKNGGDLSYFTKGQMVKPFEDAAFSLKPGEITKKPVKTQFGYHIIYLEDKKPESVAKFEEVKPEILATMKQEQFNKTIKDTIENQKKSAQITVNLKNSENNSSK